MKFKTVFASTLFLLLALSTVSYGAFVIYRNHQIEEGNGNTVVMGVVVDSGGDPVEGASVEVEGERAITGHDGKFRFDNISSGMVDIEIYRKGYIPLEIRWLAYPMDEVKDDPEDSPNNLSTERDMELLLEREVNDEGVPDNSTFTLVVDPVDKSTLIGSMFEYGIPGEEQETLTVVPGKKEYTLEGNGTFMLSSLNVTGTRTWRAVPGVEIDITSLLEEMEGMEITGNISMGTLRLDLSEDLEGGSFEVTLTGPLLGNRQVIPGREGEYVSNITLETHPGLCDILVSGKGIRDQEIKNIKIARDNITAIEIDIKGASPDRIHEDMNIGNNYAVGGLYLAFGLVLMCAAYVTFREVLWNHVLVLALASFLVRGFYVGPVPLNLILSVMLVMMLIFSRERFEERRRSVNR